MREVTKWKKKFAQIENNQNCTRRKGTNGENEMAR